MLKYLVILKCLFFINEVLFPSFYSIFSVFVPLYECRWFFESSRWIITTLGIFGAQRVQMLAYFVKC